VTWSERRRERNSFDAAVPVETDIHVCNDSDGAMEMQKVVRIFPFEVGNK
jgi:hypothetical protein